MAKSKALLTVYRSTPSYAIRASSIITSAVVTGILVFFSLKLKADGFKIPWTLLIMTLPAVVHLVLLLLTTLLQCCGKQSPLFNLIFNIPLLIIWIIGLSLLSWNITGTLGHSCSTANWGNADGIRVCNIYKVLYAFILFAVLSLITQIVLDVRARREQTRMGKYDKMADTTDIKMGPVESFSKPTVHEEQFQQEQNRDETPGWRPGAASSATLVSHGYSSSEQTVDAYQPPKYGQVHSGSDPYLDSREPYRRNDYDYGMGQQNAAYNSGRFYHDDVNRRY